MKKNLRLFLLLYLAGFAAGILAANLLIRKTGYETSLLSVYLAAAPSGENRLLFWKLLFRRGGFFFVGNSPCNRIYRWLRGFCTNPTPIAAKQSRAAKAIESIVSSYRANLYFNRFPPPSEATRKRNPSHFRFTEEAVTSVKISRIGQNRTLFAKKTADRLRRQKCICLTTPDTPFGANPCNRPIRPLYETPRIHDCVYLDRIKKESNDSRCFSFYYAPVLYLCSGRHLSELHSGARAHTNDHPWKRYQDT